MQTSDIVPHDFRRVSKFETGEERIDQELESTLSSEILRDVQMRPPFCFALAGKSSVTCTTQLSSARLFHKRLISMLFLFQPCCVYRFHTLLFGKDWSAKLFSRLEPDHLATIQN